MLVAFATNKLGVTICCAPHREINFDIKIMRKNMWLSGFPKRTRQALSRSHQGAFYRGKFRGGGEAPAVHRAVMGLNNWL